MRTLPRVITLLLLFIAATPAVQAQAPPQDDCEPGTRRDRQERGDQKHGTPRRRIRASWVSVQNILDWPLPAGVQDVRVRESQRPIDRIETKAFHLAGDVWVMKIEDNDCDIHMELSAPGGSQTSPRVIVEIPNDAAFSKARRKAFAQFVKLKADRLINSKGELASPVRVTVTGYGFYDGSHYKIEDPKKGFHHGSDQVATLWEIHPVWDAAFERQRR